MDASMQLVSKFCGQELGQYMKCIEDNPKSWQKNCEDTKQQLGWCAQQNPVIKKIRESCLSSFTTYEHCIVKNPNNVSVCMKELSEFIECAENYSGGEMAS